MGGLGRPAQSNLCLVALRHPGILIGDRQTDTQTDIWRAWWPGARGGGHIGGRGCGSVGRCMWNRHCVSPVRGSTIAFLKRGSASRRMRRDFSREGVEEPLGVGALLVKAGKGVRSSLKGVTYSHVRSLAHSKTTGLRDTGLESPLYLPTGPLHCAGKHPLCLWLTPVTCLSTVCVWEKDLDGGSTSV